MCNTFVYDTDAMCLSDCMLLCSSTLLVLLQECEWSLPFFPPPQLDQHQRRQQQQVARSGPRGKCHLIHRPHDGHHPRRTSNVVVTWCGVLSVCVFSTRKDDLVDRPINFSWIGRLVDRNKRAPPWNYRLLPTVHTG
jgi:hypothetical protein